MEKLKNYWRQFSFLRLIKKSFTYFFNNVLSIIGLIIALLLGKIAYQQTERLSSQDQKIKGFNDLLKSQKNLLDSMSKQIVISQKLDSTTNEQLSVMQGQLNVSNLTQNKSNFYSSLTDKSDVNLLYAIIFRLSWLTPNYRKTIDFRSMWNSMDKAQELFELGLTNRYLLQNDSLFRYWVNTYKSILWFKYDPLYIAVAEGENALKDLNGVGLDGIESYQRFYDEYNSCDKKISYTIFLINKYVRKANPQLTFSTINPPKYGW